MGLYSLSRSGVTPKYVQIIRQDPCTFCGRVIKPKPAKRPRFMPRKHFHDLGTMTIDHIQPRCWSAKGKHILTSTGFSRDHWTNLTPACFRCNQRRGDKPLLTFLLEIAA